MENRIEKNKVSVGIIGGTGGMGKLFNAFFTRNGIKVEVASRSTELSIEECASQNDIVIITVPIAATISTIERVAPLVKKSGVIMDLTSLKRDEVETMLTHAQCEVVGCHPVFGPSVSNFKKQVVVLTPARGERWFTFIKQLLLDEGADVKISTPQEHDQIMSVVQGLMHFTSITLIKALHKTGMTHEVFNEFSSPVYRIRTDFASRILNQNPELYADIELHNPETVAILEHYISSCNELLKVVKDKNREGFIHSFNEASDYLGEYKNTAEKKTDAIIDYTAKLQVEK